ncbi:MAG: SufS family cysteine desulfurase [Saprospiraceae bacterium]|nr:SufS family cysteine desulfurase [Saprospiraceae bacterium]
MKMIKAIKNRFPIFKHHPELVYLDSASTTHKIAAVIQAEMTFYTQQNANIHRGIYPLAVTATGAYEGTRDTIKTFVNAASRKEIIFTSGTTEGVNLVAQSFAFPQLQKGDNIVISAMEHHANLIPWQQICLQKKAELRIIPMDKQGVLILGSSNKLLDKKTKIVAITHISNTLGTINPIKTIIDKAHKRNIPVLIDAAQSIVSHTLDVQKLDVDFMVFSGHKMFAPTGVGVLYGKEKYLNAMSPYKFGGDMIRDVTFEKTIFAPLPNKFETGTPNIAGVIGLGAAIDFIEKLGQNKIKKYLKGLLEAATAKLQEIENLEIIGNAPEKTAIISFILRGVHPHDVATILAANHVAIRSGHHCTQPIMDFYDVAGTNRVSFSIYNSVEDIDKLVAAIHEVNRLFEIHNSPRV